MRVQEVDAIMILFAVIVGVLLLAWTSLIYVRLHVPGSGFFVLLFKSFAGAFSPVIAAIGLFGAILGALFGSVAVTVAYGLLAVAAGVPALRIMRTPDPLPSTFGPFQPPAQRRPYGLRHPWGMHLSQVPEPCCERDIPFWTPPDSGRPLLCDIWQPPAGVTPSHLAFMYCHGSAWTILDKDYGTRPFFRHLAAQGHVVMDVAYRLFPDTDMLGMLGDVRRAIAWLKANAAKYDIDPDRIVIGGGSAGGHLALLAAYTNGDPELTPADVRSADTAVRGVIALYGPVDLAACYRHYEIAKLAAAMPEQPDWNAPIAPAMRRLMGANAERLRFHLAAGSGRLDWMLGGPPAQVPDRYAQFSPASHVHPGCPPTLLIQGVADLIVPVAETERMYQELRRAGVRAACQVLPFTDHAFDLMAPGWSPAARIATSPDR
jgi:acetyl esterase/lipase